MGYIFDAMKRSAMPDEAIQAAAPIDSDLTANQDTHDNGAPAALPFDANPSGASVPNASLFNTPPTSQNQGQNQDQNQDQDPTEKFATVADPIKFNPTPEQAAGIDERLVTLTSPSSVMAEEYRSIRTTLLAKIKQQRNRIHMITSATPQEGKTLTSLNLGLSLSELRNRKTIVIEADLRLPQFQKLLNLPKNPGMVGLLRGEADLKDVVTEVGERKLHLVQAGSRVSDQAVDLLSRSTFKDLLKQLRKTYDHIIIDTPPVVELADAGIIGGLVDEVLLIVRMNRTPKELAEQAIHTLESYNAPVAGVIATDKTPHRRRYYGYRYGYRYAYSYQGNPKKKAA